MRGLVASEVGALRRARSSRAASVTIFGMPLIERTLSDGRVLTVERRLYNTLLTVSTPNEYPYTWSLGY